MKKPHTSLSAYKKIKAVQNYNKDETLTKAGNHRAFFLSTLKQSTHTTFPSNSSLCFLSSSSSSLEEDEDSSSGLNNRKRLKTQLFKTCLL